jgi:hypothetical protein
MAAGNTLPPSHRDITKQFTIGDFLPRSGVDRDLKAAREALPMNNPPKVKERNAITEMRQRELRDLLRSENPIASRSRLTSSTTTPTAE